MTRPNSTRLDPAIQRVRLGRVRIFEISEAELESLERGSPESIFLNLALAMASVAISFSVTLATTRIDGTRTFLVFVVVTSVSYIAAVTFAVLWYTYRRGLQSVSAQIRSRIPPEGIQEIE